MSSSIAAACPIKSETLANLRLWPGLLAALSVAIASPPARAAITAIGDVSPALPWTSSTTGYVGNTAAGTLTVDGGSVLHLGYGYIGCGSTASGVVNISGATGTASSALFVGYGGFGTLTVTNGGNLTTLPYSECEIGTYGSGAVTVSGMGSTWTTGPGFSNVDVGDYGKGTLCISDGGAVSTYNAFIAYYAGSTGTVTVDGAGSTSTWTNSDSLYVGYNGNGTLSVNNNGVVSAKTLYASPSRLTGNGTINTKGLVSDFNVVFDASGSCSLAFGTGGNLTVNMSAASGNGDLGAGYASSGALTLKNGANVYSEYGYLGRNGGSSGSATVDGVGSKWTVSQWLYVGYDGSGTLSVINGGTITTSRSEIGTYGSGAATVSGTGSTWTGFSFVVDVGDYGKGTLCISGGGAVRPDSTFIGYYTGSTGTVTVDGAGSTWTNTNNVFLGYSGAGTVTQTGGTTSVGGTVSLGANSTGSGTYNLSGGVLALHGLAAGSGAAAFNFDGGTLRADADFASSLPVNLTGNGGNATVNSNGHAVSLSGTLSGIGGLTKSGVGTLTLSAANSYTGPTTVTGGTLELQTVAARHPVLDLGGADVQSGKVVFDYASGADPAATIQSMLRASYDGGRWDVGQFRDSTATATGLTLGCFDNTVTGQVTVMATYPGDFNLDGVVNNLDLAIFYANVFTGTTWQRGDANYDGVVNGLDRDLLVSHMGLPPLSGSAPDASMTPVPEPGTLVLLAAAAVVMLACRRRRNG